MCLPRVIKSFQNYRGVATTLYPTLVCLVAQNTYPHYLNSFIINHIILLYWLIKYRFLTFKTAERERERDRQRQGEEGMAGIIN